MMPHPTRLYWDGAKGSAWFRGTGVKLHEPPAPWGEPLAYVEYTPLGSSTIAEVRDRAIDSVRQMRQDEIAKVLLFLGKLCG
jgi:hypothetical protein